MNKKTLIINQSIHDLLQMKYRNEQSVLSFPDYVIDALSRHRYQQLNDNVADNSPYSVRTFQNIQLTINTDNNWLLDATTQQINDWLLSEVKEYTNEKYTTSSIIANMFRMFDWLKIKPNASAPWYTPSHLYAKIKQYITNYPSLWDFQEIILSHERRKMNLKNIFYMILSQVAVFVFMSLSQTSSSIGNLNMKQLIKLSNPIFNNICISLLGIYLLSFILSKKWKHVIKQVSIVLLFTAGILFVNSQLHPNLMTMRYIIYISDLVCSVVIIMGVLIAFAQLIINAIQLYQRYQSVTINIGAASQLTMSSITLYQLDSDSSITITDPILYQANDHKWHFDFGTVISMYQMTI